MCSDVELGDFSHGDVPGPDRGIHGTMVNQLRGTDSTAHLNNLIG